MDSWANFLALVFSQVVVLLLAEWRLRLNERKTEAARQAAVDSKIASQFNAETMAKLPPVIVESVKLAVKEVNGPELPRPASPATGERMLSQ